MTNFITAILEEIDRRRAVRSPEFQDKLLSYRIKWVNNKENKNANSIKANQCISPQKPSEVAGALLRKSLGPR